MWPFSSPYKAIIKSKREERQRALLTASEFSESSHGEFTKATAPEIVRRIESGEWTASQVVEAYIARAALAQAVTNCITEILFEQARKEAQTLDNEFAQTKRLRGPLHGVPVSFKDQYEVEGVDASIGFTQWANKPCTKDAPIVTQYRALGAIPIVKTNVPQTMLAFECSNPLWGCTVNPWSARYTCGGSSGGEAALLAMDGAAIGAGSDIGGSLRIPSSYCGIFTLRPTAGRVNMMGLRDPVPGYEGIRTAAGPMARSVDEIEIVSRAILGASDPYGLVAPVPWRDIELPKRLRFGYYTDDGFVKASPANKRAVLQTVEALRREGHECIEFGIPLPSRALEIFAGLSSSDGYETLLSHLGPDPKDWSLFLVSLGPRLFGFARWIFVRFLRNIIGDKLFSRVVATSRVKPVVEYFKFTAMRDEYRQLFHDEVWNKYGFDGIIAPVQSLPVIPHGGCATLSPLAAATILYNVTNLPVGIVPVTRVDPSLDQLTEEWKHHHNAKSLEMMLYSGPKAVYNPEGMRGIPVGIQVVGQAWQEEKVIGMMRIVDSALGQRDIGPGMWDKSKFVL